MLCLSEWIELLREAIATQLAGNKGNLSKGNFAFSIFGLLAHIQMKRI